MSNNDKRAVLLLTTLASFLTAFMGSSTNIALPAIGREFGMDAVLLGWVPMTFSLATAVFMLPLAKLADIHGRKRVFILGVAIYLAGSLGSAAALSGAVLLAMRVIQGAGAAMMFGTGTAILTSVYPPKERGQVLGINVASVYTGLSVGPFLGGALTENWGWRSIFLLGSALGVVVIAGTVWRMRGEWADARGERFDLIGAGIYAVAMVAVIYGLSRLPRVTGVGLLLAGAIAAVVFIRWEMRAVTPLLNVGLFRHNRVFALSNLAALVNYSATSAVGFLLSLYLQYIKGLGPQAAGLVLIAQPVMQAIFSPLAGRLSDRYEARVVASAGMGLTAAGLVMLTLLNEATPFPTIVASLVLLGLGFGLFSSPNTNAVMGAVERRDYGVASATLGTMRTIGQMLSLAIATLLFALIIGPVEITPPYYPAFLQSAHIAFVIFAAACAVGIFASLARGRMQREVG
ncbi:MAG: MFS transporter [Chloroflexi bacterium]|nr:MFS transporter [Chloroflexota bacterium]